MKGAMDWRAHTSAIVDDNGGAAGGVHGRSGGARALRFVVVGAHKLRIAIAIAFVALLSLSRECGKRVHNGDTARKRDMIYGEHRLQEAECLQTIDRCTVTLFGTVSSLVTSVVSEGKRYTMATLLANKRQSMVDEDFTTSNVGSW